MNDADEAFAKAQEKIARARAGRPATIHFDGKSFRVEGPTQFNFDGRSFREEGPEIVDFGCEEFRALDRLPEEIGGFEALFVLNLENTNVSDLAPLSGLTGMEVLNLTGTDVADLAPLSGLTGLKRLWLNGTAVTDLAPLSGLTGLEVLNLNKIPVIDLRHIRELRRLADAPRESGLTFKDCAACDADPKIAWICRIADNKERATALFDYLADWVPPEEEAALNNREADIPHPPKPGVAPLQTNVIDGRLVRVGAHGLPESDAMARADAGWRALWKFRRVFGQTFNVHNYSQLRVVLDGFDAAMGEAFDPDRLILIGTMGSAVVALADDAEFREMLPTGTPPLLSQFALHIDTFVNRFPDWVTYKEEAAGMRVILAQVAEDRPAFEEIENGLRYSDETDREVAEDYAVQVAHGAHEESDPAVARGLVTSTRETMRALSEAGIEEIRSGRIARDEIGELEKVHDTELAKVKWYAGGFAIVFLRRRSASLRRLARRYPSQLGWLDQVLDYLDAA